MSLLEVENVSVIRHRGTRDEILLLDRVSLSLPSGTLLALLGPSGSGKTTFVRLLNRLEDPTSGDLSLAGRPLASYDPLELRRRVAFVPQVPYMFQESVQENLKRPFRYHPHAAPDEEDLACRRALACAGLPETLLGRPARDLSVGQQQRVALARALVLRPEILVVDEPTSALDPRSAEQVGRALHGLCRETGMCVVLVTHDVRLAGALADLAVFLSGGRMLAHGPADQLLRHPDHPELRSFLASTLTRDPT